MKVVRTISSIRRISRMARGLVVLVPTMGALHAGHATLIDRARRLAGADGVVVVSIFVNPMQFGPKEDFGRYPRPFAADRKLCAAHGVDFIFHPTVRELYPADSSTFVDESEVSRFLCGESRPGHFRGVCTVVLKLFTAVEPDVAVFGLKDYQQCAVIARMVRDLNFAVKIVRVPTVREADGLALSSRNAYLSPTERAEAPVIWKALAAARLAAMGGSMNAERIRRVISERILRAPSAQIDYVEIADAKTLQPVRQVARGTVIAVAVRFGATRLIDNILI